MFFVPIIAGWTFGVVSAKLVDTRQSRAHADVRTVTQATWDRLTTQAKEIDEKYQTFMVEHVDSLLGSTRHQQFGEIASNEEVWQISPLEKEFNRGIFSALIILGSAVVGRLLFPPLLLLSLTTALYGLRTIIKQIDHDIRHKKSIVGPLLGLVGTGGIWLGGYFVIGGLAMIIYFLGEKLVLITQDRSFKGLVNTFETPESVWVLIDDIEVETPFDKLQVGDQLMIHAGQTVPVDGTILAGRATIDQHTLTGEAQPAEKEEGDQVFASTIVLAGKIRIQVEQAGEESVAAQIGNILNNTASYQMAVEAKSLQIAEKAMLPTLLLGALAWPLVGYQAMVAVWLSGVGWNMKITGPIAMLNFLNIASNQSILVKDGRSLELLHEVDTVVFDKTGTLTQEQPHVAHIHPLVPRDKPCDPTNAKQLLTYAAAAERHQAHPIAKAILKAADEWGLSLPEIDQARYEMGYGIKVQVAEHLVQVGSDRYMRLEKITIPDEILTLQETCQAEGHSLVMVAIDERLAGAIELQPTIRPEAKQVITELRQRNLDLVIISGDQEQPTRKLAEKLGIDRYFANTLPENKATLVEQLQNEGRTVCFIGDGINDSIALKKANVSISLRGATSAATDTAQIVLMDESLHQLPFLLKLSHEFDSNMRAGLIAAIVPGVFTIAGAYLIHLGITASLMIWNLSLFANIGIAMKPLLDHQEANETTEDST